MRRQTPARHDVAWSELAARVDVEHEAPPVLVAQHRALAAHRLGDERRAGRGECGGVELGELEVGDRGAGSPGRGHAVARGDDGIGRMPVEASAAAGCEHDRVGPPIDERAGCLEAGARP